MPEGYGIEWAPAAQNDLDELLEYMAARDCVDAALHVYEKLMEKIDPLVSHPERCRIPPELKRIGVSEYRELIVSPYSVFFRLRGKRLGIVTVLDRRRDLEELLIQRTLRQN
jgi:toxin ParE1/3/4